MDFFGKPWTAPICNHADVKQRPTPIGELCYHCEEPIESEDRGFLVPHIDGDKNPERPVHLCCFIREVVGSVGHQRKKCSCYGGNEEDPPGTTKKEAALAAFAEFNASYNLK